MLTIATLNYDGLLQAGLIRLKEKGDIHFSDLGDGRPSAEAHMKLSNSTYLDAQRIRDIDDLPRNSHVHLLHLHGSLGWLSLLNDDTTWKFKIPELRHESYWTKLSRKRVCMFPRLVLTDQKAKMIAERPFSLSYRIFEDRLQESDFWFIGGYGFGDQPVNTVLEQAYRSKMYEDKPPRILIIDPNRRTREKARDVFRAYQDHRRPFRYCAAKFPEAVDTRVFNQFFGW